MINSLPAHGTVSASEIDSMNSGLGTQLLTAFAQQLGGALEQGEMGGRYVVRLSFKTTPLAEAEHTRSDDPDEGTDDPAKG